MFTYSYLAIILLEIYPTEIKSKCIHTNIYERGYRLGITYTKTRNNNKRIIKENYGKAKQ